jgi:Amt family ammonium transporter
MNARTLIAFTVLACVSFAAIWGAPPLVPDPKAAPIDTGDTAWMLTATGLVLLMTPGLSFFYGGMVRRKNVISTMLQSFVAMGVVSILWVVVGFSLAFGASYRGLIGNPMHYLLFRGVGGATDAALSPTIPLALFALFQLKFAIITPALITGSFAERVRFSSYVLFLALYTVFIYCPVAHWTWHPEGFLRQWGVLDFAGGTVVHMASGCAAFAAALVLGSRSRGEVAGGAHQPAHVPYVMLGTGMLWFGWFGFNAGSALGANALATTAFLNTNTASASAMITWMLVSRMRGLKHSALGACVGCVVGLVAITPAAGYVTVGASLFIGMVAACVSQWAVSLRARTELDDTLDVFPCHGVGGMVGMLLTGMLATKSVNAGGADGLVFGGTKLFTAHLAGLVVVAGFTFVGAWVLFKVTDFFIPLRVAPEQERMGLDLSQHGESLEPHPTPLTPPVRSSDPGQPSEEGGAAAATAA